MGIRSSDYLDSTTKDEIKKAILFLRDGGWKSEDEICDTISNDFDVSHTAVLEIIRDMTKTKNQT